jgi:hypothetical protein
VKAVDWGYPRDGFVPDLLSGKTQQSFDRIVGGNAADRMRIASD